MRCRFTCLAVALVCQIFSFFPAGAESNKTRPRYVIPQAGRLGSVEIDEYFEISDPHEAAQSLLREAGLARIDVDKKWDCADRPSVYLGAGSRSISKTDRSFFAAASSMAAHEHPDSEMVCVLKFSRIPTIRELAGFMDRGIRFYRSIPYYAYVVRMTAQTVASLEGEQPVQWVSALRPEDKYPPAKQFDPALPLMVLTLVGDKPSCREDLAQLGGEVIGFSQTGLYEHVWDYYVVKINLLHLKDVSSLWWVQAIQQGGHIQTNDEHSEISADSLNLVGSFGAFRPDDSRRLISRDANGRFQGFGQSLLIYEPGCDWTHPDLSARVLSGSSPASNANHGTMIAGIAVGGRNDNISGGSIGGVARGADFKFLNLDPLSPLAPLTAASAEGPMFQNHTWGRTDSLGVYGVESYAMDTTIDQWEVLQIFSAGNYGCFQTTETIAIPATSKNVLTVGGIYYVTEGTDTLGMIAQSSSLGPTRANILKPELVAPSGSGNSQCPADLCAQRGIISTSAGSPSACDVWDSGYAANRGTSFAAPHVSGTAAVAAEAFKYRYSQYEGQANYTMSSELMKALLINTSLPLRWNGTWPRDNGHYGSFVRDTVMTDDLRSAFANTTYGYGLVNAYSGIQSGDDEYRRVLVWQDVVQGIGTILEKSFSLRLTNEIGETLRPRYLVATLAYNDLPGATVVDRLELSLVDPTNTTIISYLVPSPLVPGAVQKIIVPWPKITWGGTWKARVRFASTASQRASPSRLFAVVVDAQIGAPRLRISTDKAKYIARVGTSTFSPKITVTNDGSNVAAGVTMQIESATPALPAGGDVGKEVYEGNLLKHGATVSHTFSLRVPATKGTYNIVVKVDAINKMLDGGPYPLRKTFQLEVQDTRLVNGVVHMLTDWGVAVGQVKVAAGDISTTSTPDGTYTLEVSKTWSGDIVPHKLGATFIPSLHSLSAGNGDVQPGVNTDYDTEFNKISGRVLDQSSQGAAGVTIHAITAPGTALISRDATTRSDGTYDVYVEHGWKGSIAPQISNGYVSFSSSPGTQVEFDSVFTNPTPQNFSSRRAALWQNNGVPMTNSTADVSAPLSCSDNLGGAVIVWRDSRSIGTNGYDIYAQRVNSSGAALWSGGQRAICTASGNQQQPALARFGDGTYVCIWQDDRNGQSDLYAQRVDANANTLWSSNGVAICTSSGVQGNFRLTEMADGSVVVAWEDGRNGNTDIYAQRLTTSGAAWSANGVSVCNTSGDQTLPDVAPSLNGESFIAWQDNRTGTDAVFAMRLDVSGGRLWTPSTGVQVSPAGSDRSVNPAVCSDGAGGCYLAYVGGVHYRDLAGPSAGYFGFLRTIRLTTSGLQTWNQTPSSSFLVDDYNRPRVVSDTGGCFVAIEALNADVCQIGVLKYHVVISRFARQSGKGWSYVVQSPEIHNESFDPSIVSDAIGGVLTTWSGVATGDCYYPLDRDVFAQHVDSTGTAAWGSYGIPVGNALNSQGQPAMQELPSTVSDGVGGALVAWRDLSGAHAAVYASRITDQTQFFALSGFVRDGTGNGIAGLRVDASNAHGVLNAVTTAENGAFYLGVPAFWQGEVRVQPRTYLNTVAPTIISVGPMISSTTRSFVISHLPTHWQPSGVPLTTDVAAVNGQPILLGTATGCAFAWTKETYSGEKDILMQRVNVAGDLQWSQGGFPLLSSTVANTDPLLMPGTGSSTVMAWRQQGSTSSSLYVQRIDSQLVTSWGNGLRIDSGVDVYGGCSDGSGGAFLCWHKSNDKVYVQHVLGDGTLAWASPLYIGVGQIEARPMVSRDGQGGMLVCWQMPSSSACYLYAQKISADGVTHWGGPNSWNPLTVRGNKFVREGMFRMVSDGIGGAYVAWSEHSTGDSFDERIRVSWIYYSGTIVAGYGGFEFTTVPGTMLIADMVPGVDEGRCYVLYDEMVGSAAGRLVLQNVSPSIQGVSRDYRWPEAGVTIAGPGPRYVTEARVLADPATKRSIVFWNEALPTKSIFAMSIDSLGVPTWLSHKYKLADNAYGPVVASDRRHGAYVGWTGDTGDLYTTRLNDSLLVHGELKVTTLVRRGSDGSIGTPGGRAVCCPKGDRDKLVFRVTLQGDIMNPLSSDALSIVWPPVVGQHGVACFQTASADSAFKFDGDSYYTTITVGELGGATTDSVIVQAFGMPVATAPIDVITTDIKRSVNGCGGDNVCPDGNVGLPDLSWFTTHYPTDSVNPKPYSPNADYMPALQPDHGTTLPDFSFWATHYGHSKSSLPSMVAQHRSSSVGQVALQFDEDYSTGQRLLKVTASLNGIEPFSVAFVALRNDNPLFEYADWHEHANVNYQSFAVPVTRDGVEQVAIVVVGNKNATASQLELGTIDLRIASTAPLVLSSDDFSLVTGDVLSHDGTILAVSLRDHQTPKKFGNSLSQNYPNPFNPSTTIKFSIAKPGHVDLTIYDVQGAMVQRVVNGERRPSSYAVAWDGRTTNGNAVASGVYFYRLRAPGFTATKKMLLLK